MTLRPSIGKGDDPIEDETPFLGVALANGPRILEGKKEYNA